MLLNGNIVNLFFNVIMETSNWHFQETERQKTIGKYASKDWRTIATLLNLNFNLSFPGIIQILCAAVPRILEYQPPYLHALGWGTVSLTILLLEFGCSLEGA